MFEYSEGGLETGAESECDYCGVAGELALFGGGPGEGGGGECVADVGGLISFCSWNPTRRIR